MRFTFRLCVLASWSVVFGGFVRAAEARSPINWTSLGKIKPGVSSRADIKILFGAPTRVTKLEETSTSKDPIDLWEYFEKGNTRLTVSFPPGAGEVRSWTWLVYDEDPETDLKTALSRYSGANWKGETEEWINPHAFPAECFYRDSKLGITIRYNEVRKEVVMISGRDPSRKIASSTDTKPPEYCIAGSCSPAMPAKDLQVPVCPVPK